MAEEGNVIKAKAMQPLPKADYELALSQQVGQPVKLTDEQYGRLVGGKFLSDDEMEQAKGAPPKPAYSGFEDDGKFTGKAYAATGTTKQPAPSEAELFGPAPRVVGKPSRPELYAHAFGAERYEPGVAPALSDQHTPFRVAADMSKRPVNWGRFDQGNDRWVTAYEDAGLNPDGTRKVPTKKTRYAPIWMPGDADKKD